MEKEKSEIKKNLDKLHKSRFGNELYKLDHAGKRKVDYFEILRKILVAPSESYLPASVEECDACLIMVSSLRNESTTYKYENTFKFMCEYNHPLLERVWKALDISEFEAEKVLELAKAFESEKLEAFFLFKDAKKHDNLTSFRQSSVGESIRKIAFDSQNGTIVSHPAKMSHPACKFPRVFSDDFKHSPDGLLRSGNTESSFDLHINATQLKVYKFISLKVNGVLVFEHIKNHRLKLLAETFQQSVEFFDEIVKLFTKCLTSQDQSTNKLLKQVYFPVDSDSYHQLSLLTPASLVFSMKSRIDWLNNVSPLTFLGKKARKNNEFSNYSYSTISNLTVTKHGGDHPKNISGLNNKYQSYYLLSSTPPDLKPRDIRLPTTDFFKESYTAWQAKDVLESLHGLFITDHNNINIRDGRDYRIQQYVDLVIEKMWQVRFFLADKSCAPEVELPLEQKVWLYPQYQQQREQQSDWLDSITRHIARALINHYSKNTFIANPVLLADQELFAIERIVVKNKELLR